MTCSQSQTFTDPPKTSHLSPGEIGEVSPTSLTVSESTRATALVRAAHRRSRRFKPYTDSSGRHGARHRRRKDHLSLNPADVLAEFDHNPDFGPGVTASRLERWVRARNLGCHPPENVLALLRDPNGTENQDPAIKFSVLRAAAPELAPCEV